MDLTLALKFVHDTTLPAPLLTEIQSVNKSFGNMESKIGQVGKSAVRIGMLLF